MTGPIPGFDLGSMTTLRRLLFSGNFFAGPLSSELGRLSGLTELAVADNSLTGTPIPEEIADLPNLQHLNLHRNVCFSLLALVVLSC